LGACIIPPGIADTQCVVTLPCWILKFLWSHPSLVCPDSSFFILCHCILEVCNFLFDFTVGYYEEFALSLRVESTDIQC
jgi:hypothetical protein